MLCDKCRANIEDDQNFCDQCGNPINRTPETEVLKDVKSSKLNTFSIVAIILGFISIFTCFWYFISIPIGIIGVAFAIVGDKKSGKEKSDYKLLLNVIGILLAMIIITIGVLFSLLEKEYIAKNYTIRYSTNWNLNDSSKNMKLMYKNNGNVFLSFVENSKFPEDINISNEEDRKSLYNSFYNMYKKNARAGAYYISTENKEFYKVKWTKDTYIAYISYSAYNGNYGRFYIIASESNDMILSFMSCADSKFTETSLHSDVIKLLEDVKFIKQEEN